MWCGEHRVFPGISRLHPRGFYFKQFTCLPPELVQFGLSQSPCSVISVSGSPCLAICVECRVLRVDTSALSVGVTTLGPPEVLASQWKGRQEVGSDWTDY